MNIITVIPLARTKGISELSYFTAADVPVGALVTVPVRSKGVSALVTATRPAFDIKAEIKNAPYPLKKLDRVRATKFFPATFVHSCKKLADYYTADIGSIIDALISDALLENASKITAPKLQGRTSTSSPSVPDETYAIQGDDEDRIGSWRSLIRQEFARKRSVVIYAPTIEDTKNISATLTKGIEGYIFTLHSKLTKKQLIETWESIASTAHSIVVVATGSFAILPREDIDTVIIERENGRGWIGTKLPYMDMRHALETIARDNGQTVYRADSLLRAETLYRVDNHEISLGSPFKWRSVSLATDALIDMKQAVVASRPQTNHDTEQPTLDTTPKFRVLSRDLEDLIRYNKDESTHLFILTIRRGSSPITVCSDCDTVVTCKNCSGPVVLHTSTGSGKNFFMCHRCGERRSAVEVCITCGGWRLAPLGIGIDKVYEDIKERFPLIDIFKIDADSAKTDAQIADVLEKFRSKPGSILLGTEMALVYLTEKIDHIAIASLDSLFALPDFRIHEKIMHMLIRLRGLARRSFLVQSRKADEKVFDYGLKGNLSDFYRATLDDRKQFSYPPYSTLIKITIEGKKDAIAARMAEVQRLLEPREIDIFPAFTATVRGNSIIHGLLKLPQGGWPNTDLLEKLRQLPPDVKVKVDPESLL
jgi:primosomal protein N'